MKYYVTLTGLNYRYGTMPFAVGQKVRLVKEPENQADREAIRAELPGLGKVGYVANSTHTVKGDCYSSRVPIKQYLQKFPQWGRFGVTSVTPFLLLPVHPEGCTPARRT